MTVETVALITHSRLSCFRACPRRHYLRYELGLRQDKESLPLRVGSAFHAALEARDKDMDPEAAIGVRLTDPYDLAMVAAMYHGYTTRWPNRGNVVAAELEFQLPLRNPGTGAASTVWELGGKMDRIVRLADGRLALWEYKTTSRDFAPGSDYWLRLHMDQQLSIYVLAARASGYDVDTVIYDVTRRPQLRPLKATPIENRKYKKDGALYANQRDVDETPEEYAARCAADIAARPEHYFARVEIARLDADLDDCAAELWQQQKAIREAQRMGRWYRNPEACVSASGWACDFLSVCLNRDLEHRTPDGFVRNQNVHPELSHASNE